METSNIIFEIENINGLKRSDYCGNFRREDIGKEITVFGWAGRQRDLGQVIFIDLRDRTGILQLAFDDKTDRVVFDKAFKIRSEFVLAAKGILRERSSVNNDIPTGKVELEVAELRILSRSETPPFEVTDNCSTAEISRLKHRYIDLRRPILQNNIIMRHKITKVIRDFFDKEGFIEIDTPILIKSTPEGARDFVVPSRLHPGSFYALPQSPQLYKQLSMVAGFDKYMQIARCFRDEDLRADRQPEFTQIDLEMSFVEMEDILTLGEKFMKTLFNDVLNVNLPETFPRLTYTESMNRFGSDKPDIRFGMELVDLSKIVSKSEFIVFKGALDAGGTVRAINAKGGFDKLSRKVIDKKLTELVKGSGGKGLAWARFGEDGMTSSFAKFMSDSEMDSIVKTMEAETGDVVLVVADTSVLKAQSLLGALRLEVANLLEVERDSFAPLWVVDMPFFEKSEETGAFVAMHHPFTAPLDECVQYLESEPEKVFAKAYDLVLNGAELSSGSIRITDPVLQKRMFTALGLSDDEAYEKFGFLTDAFKYGAPPHGGFGIGLDRLIMEMLVLDNIRDVIPFPKIQNMSEPMTNCPAKIDDEQLEELGIKLIAPSDVE